MVTPYTRGRADSGNVNRHTCRAMRAIGVPCKQPASTTDVKEKMEEDSMEGALFVLQLRWGKQAGNVASA
jgi:hypothetical protein